MPLVEVVVQHVRFGIIGEVDVQNLILKLHSVLCLKILCSCLFGRVTKVFCVFRRSVVFVRLGLARQWLGGIFGRVSKLYKN